jgi:cell division transport system permease protein
MSEKQTARGASASTVSTKDVFGAWLAHHQFSARMSLQKMAAEPLSSVMTSLVLGIALALPVSLFVVTENIKALSGNWNDNPQVSVFVRQNISSASTLALGNKLQQVSGVLSVVYMSPESALEQFRQYAGFGEALKLLDENPLPAVYVVKPISADAGSLTLLSQQLEALPEVEYVQLDLAWIQKLQRILNLAERFIFLFGFLLGLGVVLTIANTIRLAIENRREEIIVVKLVGGTDAFVRRPLLYSGLCYGLAGAMVALLLVGFVTYLLTGPSLQLALLYESPFLPQGLAVTHALLLLLAGALLGLSGAWLAAARDLHKYNHLTH